MSEVRNMKVMLLLLVVLHMSTQIVATEKKAIDMGYKKKFNCKVLIERGVNEKKYLKKKYEKCMLQYF